MLDCSRRWSTIPQALLNYAPRAARPWSTSAAKWSPSLLRADAWPRASNLAGIGGNVVRKALEIVK